ncbi:MAG: leucine-rich repeat protein, partial [Clostridiales bacterium]|nr:leucine-rich repeat protein [Clostridiales bacterium]
SDDIDYSVSVDVDGDVTITNGGNVQTGSVTDMIVYADSLCSVFISDGDIILVGSNGNSTQMIRLGDSFTIERASGVLTIGDGTSVYQPSGSVEWAYVPIGTGTYGSFGAGGLQRDQTPLVAVGSFAGVGCYNDLITPDYGLVMDADVTEEYINSVKWALGLGGQDDDAEQTEQTGQTDPSPSPSLTVLDSPEPDTDGGEDPVLMDVPPETDAGDGDGDSDTEPTRGETEGSGGLRSVPSYNYTDGDWGYNLISSNPYRAQVVYYLGAGGDVSIPTSLGGYTVMKIGLGGSSNAVFDTSLAIGNLTITNGWTSPVTISTYAFYGCNITGTLQLIGTFNLNDYAFANSGIIWVDPVIENQTQWGKNIFENCTGMTGTLTVNTDYQLGNYCFKGTGISKVVVNKMYFKGAGDVLDGMPNLTEIEWNWNHNLSVGDFGGCPNIERIIITSGGITDRVFCNLNALEYVSISGISTFKGQTFENCPLLSTVVLSPTITTIGEYYYYGSFNNCPSLTDINLGNVTTIYNSFNTCASLVNMDLSSVSAINNSFRYSSLTSLSLSATRVEGSFNNSSLTEISLPNATYVSGFESCSSLTKVILSENLTTIPQRGFYSTANIKELTLPISANVYFGNDYTCFGSVKNLEKITFLKGTGIGRDYSTGTSSNRYDKAVWIRCASKLTSVTFESGITRIGDNMFRGMTSIPAITLPDTLESIGNSSFWHCGLTGTLSLPDTLVSIGDSAFTSCTGCTGTLTLPSSLTTIGSSAFGQCTGLTGSLVIPASVTSLGVQAFSGCNGLTGSLSIPSNVGSISNSVFSKCT